MSSRQELSQSFGGARQRTTQRLCCCLRECWNHNGFSRLKRPICQYNGQFCCYGCRNGRTYVHVPHGLWGRHFCNLYANSQFSWRQRRLSSYHSFLEHQAGPIFLWPLCQVLRQSQDRLDPSVIIWSLPSLKHQITDRAGPRNLLQDRHCISAVRISWETTSLFLPACK